MTSTGSEKVLYLVKRLDIVPNAARESIRMVQEAGYEPIVHDTRRTLTEDELRRVLPGTVGCISNSHPFTAYALEAADKLRVISRTGAGYERIDLDYCTKHGIVVANSFGANAVAVAEFTIGLMLNVARAISVGERALRAGKWSTSLDFTGAPVVGRTLGIVGFGHIGREVARLAAGLRMKVMYYDVHRASDAEQSAGAAYRDLHELLPEVDFLSIHVALNTTTRGMVGAKELAVMKPSAYVINTSRGGVIDEVALYTAIRAGSIAGAALDVFDEEPVSPSSNQLFSLPNGFVCTPHMAGLSHDAEIEMLNVATRNLLEVLAGREPPGVLNPNRSNVSSTN